MAHRTRSRKNGIAARRRKRRQKPGDVLAHFHNLSWVHIFLGIVYILGPLVVGVSFASQFGAFGAGIGLIIWAVCLPIGIFYVSLGLCLKRFHAWARIVAIILGALGTLGGLSNVVYSLMAFGTSAALGFVSLALSAIYLGASLYTLVTLVPNGAARQYAHQREVYLDRYDGYRRMARAA